jgi:hypothetical protein
MRFKASTAGHGSQQNKETFLVTLHSEPRCDGDVTFIPTVNDSSSGARPGAFNKHSVKLLLHYKFLVCVIIECLVGLHSCTF